MSNKEKGSSSRFQGVLTPTDKAYLNGEKEYKGDSKDRDAQYRIRQRVIKGVKDFSFIKHRLNSDQSEKIAVEAYRDNPSDIVRTLSYIYEASDHISANVYDNRSQIDFFEELLENAIFEDEIAKGNLPNLSIDISIEERDVDKEEMIEKALDEEITRTELRYLQLNRGYSRLLSKIIEEEEIVEVVVEGGQNYDITPNYAEQILNQSDSGN